MTEPPIIAEVISIGDEMTSGARLDTNAQWLSRRLGELGVTVAFHATVGDTLQHNVDVFRIAAMRADVVVATGGLGPTRDDLTRQALADLVGQPLELNPASLEHIQSLFARRNREMPERNQIQAMFPRGSQEIFNPQGTAPGVDVTFHREAGGSSRIFALPGVPAEMKRMFDDTVAPRILLCSGGNRKHIQHCVMKFFGIGESDMEHRLGEMISRERSPRVGITVSSATISLRITAVGDSVDECQRQINVTREEIMERVGDLYFGDGEEYEQYHSAAEILTQRRQSVATVEFGHSAVLANWFASLGQSPAHRGGFSFADVGQLAKLLDVSSEEALQVLHQRCGSNWMLAVDAYPALQNDGDQPQGATEVQLVVLDETGKRYATKTVLGGHPSIIHARIGKAALAWLRKVLVHGDNAAGGQTK